ncbi:MAG: SURF1 family protein [Noviherbaspirillum sp.]
MKPDAPRRRSKTLGLALLLVAALACAGFVALGTWQVHRLQWKLDLIERVAQRVNAAPVPAPGRPDWERVSAANDEYRRVALSGTLLHALAARVQASTVLGSGYWLMTPLRRADGSVVMVNLGFIPANQGRAAGPARPDTEAEVTGLLRMSEPGGGFLRSNDPAAERWYSRDVAALAAARGLPDPAPYFIDADAASAARLAAGSAAPVGGLTVVSFHNNHLVYALTWYALALMLAGACLWVARGARRLEQEGGDGGKD